MSAAIAAGLLVSVAMAAPTRSRMALPPPRSRLGREAAVFATDGRPLFRTRQPGAHSVEVPCDAEGPATVRLTLKIAADPAGEAQPPRYEECSAEEALRRAGEGSAQAVRFEAALDAVLFSQEGAGRAVALWGGAQLSVGCAFRVKGGPLCLIPGGRAGLRRFVRAAVPGDELAVRARLARTAAGEACAVVDGVRFAGPEQAGDEPPWQVSVRWGDAPEAVLAGAGDHRLAAPCPTQGAANPFVIVRLRELKLVDLAVDGHPVVAELADTPAARSWGLQGRAGLAPDEGMLFFFERPLRPIFAMKTASFPLSIAFIRRDGAIVSIEKLNPGERRGVSPSVPVNYVLEMEQGWFERHEVTVGDVVRVP